MTAKYILAVLACGFVVAGLLAQPYNRTYLLVATAFTLVSLWLFMRG